MKIRLILLTFFFLSSTKIFACECSFIKSVKEEIKSSNYVAVGKVLKIEYIYIPNSTNKNKKIRTTKSLNRMNMFSGIVLSKITFEISETFKGTQKRKKRTIYTGIGGGDCGFYFKSGERYLIYANHNSYTTKDLRKGKRKFKNALYTSNCKRTKKYSHKEIRQIKEILK